MGLGCVGSCRLRPAQPLLDAQAIVASDICYVRQSRFEVNDAKQDYSSDSRLPSICGRKVRCDTGVLRGHRSVISFIHRLCHFGGVRSVYEISSQRMGPSALQKPISCGHLCIDFPKKPYQNFRCTARGCDALQCDRENSQL
jgi:hypothetical protein